MPVYGHTTASCANAHKRAAKSIGPSTGVNVANSVPVGGIEWVVARQ